MVRFSFAAGLREANETGLEWSQVDLERRLVWAHPTRPGDKGYRDSADRRSRAGAMQPGGESPRLMLTHRGRPVTSVNTKASKTDLGRPGITDFRWRDLRQYSDKGEKRSPDDGGCP